MPVPSNAAKHVVALWADSAKEKPFILKNNRNRDPLDADKKDHRINGRHYGQEKTKDH